MRRMATLPNLLTLSRLLSLPAIIAMHRAGHPVAAGAVFIVAMLTDCVDGWLARRLGQQSRLGLYLDPVVDKVMVLVLFYELARAGRIGWAVAHLFLVRELLHNAIRSVAASRGRVIGANWMGKTKASLQTVLLAWGLLLPALPASVQPALGQALAVSAWAVLALAWGFFAAFAVRNRAAIAGN